MQKPKVNEKQGKSSFCLYLFISFFCLVFRCYYELNIGSEVAAGVCFVDFENIVRASCCVFFFLREIVLCCKSIVTSLILNNVVNSSLNKCNSVKLFMSRVETETILNKKHLRVY